MKVLLQRVSRASVSVEGEITGQIGQGVLLLVGIGKTDDAAVLKPMAEKISTLRIFPDENGRFHHSLLDISGGALAVPQFTLFADTNKGRRPEFFEAAPPEKASPLFDAFVEELKRAGIKSVQTGVFGAHMQVELLNDGPVTIMLER